MLDQYTDDRTMYRARTKSLVLNHKNINAALDTIYEFHLLSGLNVNRGKTMLTIFRCQTTDNNLCDELKKFWPQNLNS